MASSPIVAVTAQSACLGVASSILAQALTAYNEADGKPMSLTIDWVPVLQYLLYILISTPPNFMWQQLLESSFPAYPANPITPSKPTPPANGSANGSANGRASRSPSADARSSDGDHTAQDTAAPAPALSKSNTLAKLLLDQTVSAALNTLLYSIFTHSVRAAMHPQPVLADPLSALRLFLPVSSSASSAAPAVDFARVRWEPVWAAARAEFWPMLTAGLRLWPLVSLLNFSLVKSVQGRNLVAGVAGLGWGVYVCLAAGKQ